MRIKEEIKVILEQEGSIKARDLAKKLAIRFKSNFSKKEINHLLYGALSPYVENSGFPNYEWSLKKKKNRVDDISRIVNRSVNRKEGSITTSHKMNVDEKTTQENTQEIIVCVEEKFKAYSRSIKKYRAYFKLNTRERTKFFDEMLELKSKAHQCIEETVDSLVTDKIKISDLNPFEGSEFFNEVRSHDKYLKWVSNEFSKANNQKIKIEDANPDKIVGGFKNQVEATFFEFNTEESNFDYLVNLVIKDNIITENEELFLRQKVEELNLDKNLVEKAKKAVHYNNTYIDNLLKIIFEDNKVTKEELIFLKEKKEEYKYDKEFVNGRFWKIGLYFYFNSFLKMTEFHKIIKLWHVLSEMGYNSNENGFWVFNDLDIFYSNNFSEIIKNGVEKIEARLKKFMKSENFQININEVFEKVNLPKNYPSTINSIDNKNHDLLNHFLKILEEEKIRLGSPDAHLLVENVIFRISNYLKYGAN